MKASDKFQVSLFAATIVLLVTWATSYVSANNVTYPTKNYTFSPGTTISSSQVNSNFDQLFNEIGGNIGTSNILDNAITNGKIANGAVTAAKVTGSGSTEQWLSGASTWTSPVPTGTISIYAGSTAPTRWLLCYGQAVSRTVTYNGLYSVISTTYGVGDGTTTFNVPDLRGRFVAGADSMGGSAANRLSATYYGTSAANVGVAGGSENATLTIAQLAAHTHSEVNVANQGGVLAASNAYFLYYPGTTTTGSTGSGDPHKNVPPALTLNYIIKY